ncbi:hypothetical protein MHYP_G00003500 [Metynnis hypsauchen]
MPMSSPTLAMPKGTYSWANNADIGVALYRNQVEALRVCEHQDDGNNGDYATSSDPGAGRHRESPSAKGLPGGHQCGVQQTHLL